MFLALARRNAPQILGIGKLPGALGADEGNAAVRQLVAESVLHDIETAAIRRFEKALRTLTIAVLAVLLISVIAWPGETLGLIL